MLGRVSSIVFYSLRWLDGFLSTPSLVRKKCNQKFELAEYLPPFPNAMSTPSRQAG